MADKKIKISVVVTVLNEEENISILLDALAKQTIKPLEIIMVDGGSDDNTVSKISRFAKASQDEKKIKLFFKKGNRSVGRNFGVSKTKGDWVAFTDAGCVPDKNWLTEIAKPVVNAKQQVEVIAGYYYGLAKNNFEAAVVPYALVMPDRVDPKIFLPATRSMLIKKSLFESLGGFDERLSDNEDYVFARKMQNSKCKIIFAKKAKVAWMPSKNLWQFCKMIFRFARGDAYARIFRPKVMLIFLRYILFAFLSIYAFKILVLLLGVYIVWSILKNQKYVKNGWYYLPILQIISDVAVMMGSLSGLLFVILGQ